MPVSVDPEVGPLPALLIADVRLYPAKRLVDVELVEGDVVGLVAGAGEPGGQLAVGSRKFWYQALTRRRAAASGWRDRWSQTTWGSRLASGPVEGVIDSGNRVDALMLTRSVCLPRPGRVADAAWQRAAGASSTGTISCVERRHATQRSPRR